LNDQFEEHQWLVRKKPRRSHYSFFIDPQFQVSSWAAAARKSMAEGDKGERNTGVFPVMLGEKLPEPPGFVRWKRTKTRVLCRFSLTPEKNHPSNFKCFSFLFQIQLDFFNHS
jgi:hypothetical protein